jgi:hypothetical protein
VKRIPLEKAKEIREEYIQLACYDQINYVASKARELGLDKSTIYNIVKAKKRFSVLRERESES